MEQYKENLKLQNILLVIGSLIMALFSLLAIGSELGWFSLIRPTAGDSHWHSAWNGFITGAGCGLLAFMVFCLIRNCRAMKDEKLLKKLHIKTHDERTVQIVTMARSTAMQILIWAGLVGTVIAGYFSVPVSLTILCCTFASSVTSLILTGYFLKKM